MLAQLTHLVAAVIRGGLHILYLCIRLTLLGVVHMFLMALLQQSQGSMELVPVKSGVRTVLSNV